MTANQEAFEEQFLEAARAGDLDTLNACLAENVDVDLRDLWGETALMWAVLSEHHEIVATLLTHGSAVDLQTALMHAVWGEYHEAVAELLANGATPDCHTTYRWTPLMHAAFNGNTKIASMLLQHGASYDLQNDDGKTAMDFAIEEEHNEIASAIQAEVERRALTNSATPLSHQPKKVKL